MDRPALPPPAPAPSLILRPPRRLTLRHPLFRTFSEPYFRMSEADRQPVFAFQLDDREATLPIPRLMREFGIAPQDEDGQLLALVGPSLQFVTGLRIGDPIPSEVLTGEASWIGEMLHRDLAVTRINMFILAWMAGYTADRLDKMTMASVLHGRDVVSEVTAGVAKVALHLGRPPGAVMQRMGALANEIAHIEALREWLLRGAQRMGGVVTRLSRTYTGDSTNKDMLAQIRRLCAKGIAEMQAEFTSVDLVLADPPRALGDGDAALAAIRATRDALYCRWRAWEPFNREWGTIEARANARTMHLAHETYQFLAPRYMTAMEWRGSTRRAAAPPAPMPAPAPAPAPAAPSRPGPPAGGAHGMRW